MAAIRSLRAAYMSFTTALYRSENAREGKIAQESQLSVHRIVLGHDPLAGPMLERNREEALIDAGLGWTCIAGALSTIVKNHQRRCIFPVDEFP